MLQALSIRNVVLIDRLDLTFQAGFSVLTGETGAGKSILLDALGLALGARATSQLIRKGADQTSVTAEFALHADHPVFEMLGEHDIEHDGSLLLRRTLTLDGRTRAFINDQPVSLALLASVGSRLVEIHGQFDQLLNPSTHRAYLDLFAGLGPQQQALAVLYADYRAAKEALESAEEALAKSTTDEAYVRHCLDELDRTAPLENEEEQLLEKRGFLQHRARLLEALTKALQYLRGERGAEGALTSAYKHVAKATSIKPDDLTAPLETLDRLIVEVHEMTEALETVFYNLGGDGESLEEIEGRLYALRDLARKHQCAVTDLPAKQAAFAAQLALIDNSGPELAALRRTRDAAGIAYQAGAEALSAARRAGAEALSQTLVQELPSLKLERAAFEVRVDPVGEAQWGPSGSDHVEFMVSLNPGLAPGSIAKIASGGERSRLMLAMKVLLARESAVPTLIFDEIDAGVGGAVSTAIGERLHRLGEHLQVFAITHAPQVSALADHHYRVQKAVNDEAVVTTVVPLDQDERREEVARMLAGDAVTDEARAAADRLRRSA